jgi:hypothetical protein
MTYQELVKTIQALPLEERLSLLEVLTSSLQADFPRKVARPASLAEVRGMLKVEGSAPTDEQIENGYTDYLIEKYA